MRCKKRKIVVLYGCGDMGIQVYHILKHNQDLKIIGFIDDNLNNKGKKFLGLPIFGDAAELSRLLDEAGLDCGIATIGNNEVRYEKNKIMQEMGLEIISAIHPQALIDSPEYIGEGVVVEMGAAIHPASKVEQGVFIGGGAIIAHGSSVGEYSLIAGGVVFGGGVTVGKFSLLGVGTLIKPYIQVGSNVVTGVGSVVTNNIRDNVVAYGVPAKIMKENNPLPTEKLL